jgi:hypothetical protein
MGTRVSRSSVSLPKFLKYVCIGCSVKFPVKVGVEESIENAPRITDQLFKSNLTFCVFLICRLTMGAFTVASSAPTLTGNFNEHPIFYLNRQH